MITQPYSQPKILSRFAVGVGLRSHHYSEALSHPYNYGLKPDFVEVHAENFFARGGATRSILEHANQNYILSVHGTGMGLGSLEGLDTLHLKKFKHLIEQFQPAIISEHAAFSLGRNAQQFIHAGDLLPLEFNQKTLKAFESNLHQAQDTLGRILLIENICSYVSSKNNEMSETEFLSELSHRTGCGLLIDLNNLVVNAFNGNEPNIQNYIKDWLNQIPSLVVGEFHLAGCAPVDQGEIMVDDHSTKISAAVWEAYEQALTIIGPRPTLIEWDTELPSWDVLLGEVAKARLLGQKVLSHE